MADKIGITKCRALFLSDIHLGTRGCQAERLIDFLRHHEAETIYLVGDIVDCWAMKRGWYWPQSHNDVVQKLLRHARKGTRLIFIPGNHDEPFRDYCGTHFGGVEIMLDAIHEAEDGRRYLVTHGDEFDGVVKYAKWLAVLGDGSYTTLLWMNRPLNWIRRRFGLGYWSLSAYVKLKVKNAVQFINDYEVALADEARRRGVDGVICGHIHHAEIRDFNGITYMNDGDWVESCTAIIETDGGEFQIVRWADDATGAAVPDTLSSNDDDVAAARAA